MRSRGFKMVLCRVSNNLLKWRVFYTQCVISAKIRCARSFQILQNKFILTKHKISRRISKIHTVRRVISTISLQSNNSKIHFVVVPECGCDYVGTPCGKVREDFGEILEDVKVVKVAEMEEKIRSLNKLYDLKDLKTFVQGLSLQRLCLELNSICLKDDGADTLQIIFKGFSNSGLCLEKKAKIFSEVLSIIQTKKIQPQRSAKLVAILSMEVENLPTSHLVNLANVCLQIFQNHSDDDAWKLSCIWEELLPQILAVISEKPVVEQDGTIVTGREFKSEVVTAVFMREWKSSMLTNMACMFINMPLTPEEHLKVVNKLCKFIERAKFNEIPPLMHQLLQLTKEQNSMPLFLALAEFFNSNLYAKIKWTPVTITQNISEDLKEIQAIEGTVLYHVHNAASGLSPKSVKDFLKMLKECLHHPQFILRPFFVTLLLDLCGISYAFEQEVMAVLTPAIMTSIAEDRKVFNSAWLGSVVPEKVNIDDLFNKVVSNCRRDRDRIFKGLVSLGFSLLGQSKARGRDGEVDEAWRIGTSLLVTLSQSFPHVTQSIFQGLVNQISQVQDSTQYTECLTKMASKRPLNLLECSGMIMQLLGNISGRLSAVVGQRVLVALLPLTKMSPPLRDNLIIFLRKSLFSDQSSREMAVYGFLELLKDLQIKDVTSLSQSISQNYVGITQIYSGTYDSGGGTVSNEGMCLEILTILKQVFEYHTSVKVTFYKGVYDSYYVNPKLGAHILDNLKSRFDQFFRGPNETPPFMFNEVVVCQGSSVVIKEPIPHLVFAIALIVGKTDDEYQGKRKFGAILDSVCDSMAESDVHHFELDKESSGDNISDDGLDAQLKREKIRQILGVYEALIGYILCNWRTESVEHARRISGLFKGYSRLLDYGKTAGKPPAKKKQPEDKKPGESTQTKGGDRARDKAKAQPFKFSSQTVLNLKCASRLIAILTGAPVSWAKNKNADLLKTKRDLHRYAYTVVLDLITDVRSLSPGEMTRKKHLIQYISFIGRVLYGQCLCRLAEVKEFDTQCSVLAMDCLYEFLSFICCHFRGKLSKFLTEMGVTETDLKDQVKVVLVTVLDLLTDLLEEVEDDETKEEVHVKKLCLTFISISSLLVNQLPREGSQCQQILEKIRLICLEKKIRNVTIAKALLSLYLSTYSKVKPFDGRILDLVLCLCDSMTLIDEDIEIDSHENYAIVNMHTVNSCLTCLCDALHLSCNDIEWALVRCKTECLTVANPTGGSQESKWENVHEKEREICRRLNYNIKLLSTICTIAVPPGTLSDVVLREIGNVYAKLILAIKYFNWKFTKFQQSYQTARFEKTIKIADVELSKNMYCFTEHIIADGSANSDETSLKKHKKDAVALRNKVRKETRGIPKVILGKEEFQKHVLQLAKKTKTDLEIKSMMARDYRLYAKQVKEIIEKEKCYDEELLLGRDDDDDDIEESQPKRVRLADDACSVDNDDDDNEDNNVDEDNDNGDDDDDDDDDEDEN